MSIFFKCKTFFSLQKDTAISISNLNLMLIESNFYHHISITLTMFYPFDTFGLKNDVLNGKV